MDERPFLKFSVSSGMIPMELITMAAGSLAGFAFRFMAERAKDRQAQFEMMMKVKKADEDSRKAASERENNDSGKFIRRVIVMSILFGVVLAPFILALLGKSSIVEIDIEKPSYFFGLFGGGTETSFVEMPSYLLIPEVRESLMAIIGYYFGSATAACKS